MKLALWIAGIVLIPVLVVFAIPILIVLGAKRALVARAFRRREDGK